MPFYKSSNVRLHYVSRDAQRKNSPHSMVFQHGIGGDVRQPGRLLLPERTGLAAGALNILHADFRGQGQSELGPVESLSIATLGRDLAALLDHLELPNAIIGGISMGAAPALRLAVQYPERCRALVLCRPAWADGPMSVEARQTYALVADLLAAEDWQSSAFRALEQNDTLQSLEATCPDAAKSIRGQVQSVLSRPESRENAIARLRHLPPSKGLDDHGESLRTVRCPILVLASEGDPIHPFECARHLAQFLPNCRLIPIAPKSALDDAPYLKEVDHKIGEFLSPQLALQPEATEAAHQKAKKEKEHDGEGRS
jgi:pimeloyl-ACP methyl ester carboxylesterase